MTAQQPDKELVLSSTNRRLAELLHAEPLPLARGGGKSLEDPLWVWGIVGGKDVGKTTLINALAGGEVVDRGEDVGEGTFQPAVYLTDEDLQALQTRFSDLAPLPVAYHPDAPATMRNLALVDLPDFDSLYADHVDTVRRIAGVLDGIIWVTTPKKVGDLRAIREIHRVLKARTNFAYVVNKMDWLLAQTDLPPVQELERTAVALKTQVAVCDPDDGAHRSFLIAAKYGTAESMLEAIERRRSSPEAAASPQADGALAQAVNTLLSNFEQQD